MSNLRKLDVNNKKEWVLVKNYCDKYRNKSLYKELLLIKREKNSNLEENKIVTKEYYFTMTKKEIDNLSKVSIEKDRKVAHIEPINTNIRTEEFIKSLSHGLIINQNLEEVFVFVNNKKMIPNLLKDGFISLNDENDKENYIPLLLEREI